MAKKASLKTISSGFASNTQLNSNFEALNDKLENTLSLDGSTPNSMGADIDLNGNDIINVGSLGFEGGGTLQDYVDNASASAAAAATAQTNAETAETAAESAQANAETAAETATSQAVSAAEALASITSTISPSASVMDFHDYDYVNSLQLQHVRNNDVSSQDEAVVTAGIQSMMDAMMAFIETGGSADKVAVVHCRGKFAVNDELFSETFAEKLWNLTSPLHSRFIFNLLLRRRGPWKNLLGITDLTKNIQEFQGISVYIYI